MKTFKEFLLNEGPPPMGGAPMGGGAPLGADPMGGGMGDPMGGMGGPPMGGGAPPMGGMGGDPMGGMGGPPMGGGAPPTQQVPISIKDADVWKVFDHLLNKKPLPKEPEKQSPFAQNDPMGGGMGADPMGGGMDPMSPPPDQGGMPGAPSPMGGPPMGGGLMS